MRIFSNKGNSAVAVPIVIAIIFFVFIIFAVTFINIFKPFVAYEKLSATSLKYIFIMEEFGYLTSSERLKLFNDLESKGLEKEKITLRATSEKKDFGDPISLILTYQCDINIPEFSDSIIPKIKTKNIEVKVSKYSFSKR